MHVSAPAPVRRLLAVAGLGMWLFTCIPPGEAPIVGIVIDLNDATTRRIYEFQNDRRADSLTAYLLHDEASYRYLAARAFGSFATLPVPTRAALAECLHDDYELVRTAAAYAIGQAGSTEDVPALAGAFDTLATMNAFNADLLAAIGKVGDAATQRQITAITTYGARDTLLRSGRLWSLFYFARNGIQTAVGDAVMVECLLDPDAPPSLRHPAAYYAQRFPLTLPAGAGERIRAVFRTETDPDVLMGLAGLLGTAGTPEAQVALTRGLADQADWRVRVEILKALSNYDYALTRTSVLERLSDPHPLVRRQAAEFLLAAGSENDAAYYHRFAKDSTRQDIRYVLYGAANRYLPMSLTDYRGRINYDLQQAFAESGSVYDQADIIRSLAEFPWNYRTIHDLYRETDSDVVRSAAADALQRISEREDFDDFFRNSAARVRADLAEFFREMITGLRVGPAYHAAAALEANPDIYRPLYADQTWLNSSLEAFTLPRQIEAYYAVNDARAALAGEPAPEHRLPDNGAHRIDWELLAGEGSGSFVVKTSAGRLTLRMLPDVAPATVSNFLELAESGYYDGKVFHRVVPNFVAQGGGPIGDGFGAEDYIVRTETPGIRYDRPGLVGMASAGRDTEGVQFFITHRPTPHLDGNYTIFAEVTEGQDVVDQITVGTRIESIASR